MSSYLKDNLNRTNYLSMYIRFLTRIRYFLVSLVVFAQFHLLCYAGYAPHVLLITGVVAETNSPTGPVGYRQLMYVSESRQLNVENVPLKVWVGKDQTTLVLLSALSSSKEHPLWVLDRKNGMIINSNVCDNVNILSRNEKTGNLIAVQSEESKVYFPVLVKEAGESRYGFTSVNWKTGKLEERPFANKGINVDQFIQIPVGFAISFKDTTALPEPRSSVALYNTVSNDLRIIPMPSAGYNDDNPFHEIIFVPDVGLMQYYHTNFTRLTSADLSTNFSSMEKIQAQPARSQIFVRVINGDPCLIWGDNESGHLLPFGYISRLFVFDLKSKSYLLNEILDTSASTFQPDETGEKVYFLDANDKKIKCISVESKKIATFSDTPIRDSDGAVMVDAY